MAGTEALERAGSIGGLQPTASASVGSNSLDTAGWLDPIHARLSQD